MSITNRFEPETNDIMELINAYEMLRLNCKRLLAIVKRTAKTSCDPLDNCLSCDALSLLREIGESE